MSYRYERRRRRGGVGCLAWLVAIVWILLLALLIYRFLLRPPVSRFVGEQIGSQLRGNVGEQIDREIEQGARLALPTVIAGLPSGELRITEAQANDYLTNQVGAIGPVESASVRFVPGEVQADLTALGTTNTARMGLAVQDGRVIAVNPQLDGMLAQFVSFEELAGSLQQQLNDELAAQGRRATDVRIEAGALVLTID